MLFSLVGLGGAQSARTPEGQRISGPVVHENLAVYFVHGKSAPGKVPLTLEEAMAKGVVQVRETSNVNQLEIENLGDDEVFVQSGDIVKGGQQDRTLMVSLVLPPKSGRDPDRVVLRRAGPLVGARPRGCEEFRDRVRRRALARDEARDEGAAAGGPGRRTSSVDRRRAATVDRRRRDRRCASSRCGRACARRRPSSTGSLGASVRSAQSASSLQLALENEKLIDAQKAYIKALKAAGESGDDIVGFVFAVNGKLNSADVYPSNGLFRKMWGKLLTASAIEAIGHKDEPRGRGALGRGRHRLPGGGGEPARRARSRSMPASGSKPATADKAYLLRDRARGRLARLAASWVHRNYLAK